MKTIDWEQRRYEIAKDILPSILNAKGIEKAKFCVSLAVTCSDILIRRLKSK